ncbi:hypothetical protein [Solemya velesiana gill symbiont]|uniref:Uncharacterized protein n=1 Tax=Solemya velesiana gill symbiont TaxID=1918948 RepID=A0A1T2KWA8_9GAMM|nr:hypothetical protein [Solemya velesiana gill symbiont]OOZ37102.1 hypothetical protein BOW51_04140 [Solemya velesiana gill symbiont]
MLDEFVIEEVLEIAPDKKFLVSLVKSFELGTGTISKNMEQACSKGDTRHFIAPRGNSVGMPHAVPSRHARNSFVAAGEQIIIPAL